MQKSSHPSQFDRTAVVLGVGAAAAVLIYDPRAEAADIKRVGVLIVALIAVCGLLTQLATVAFRERSERSSTHARSVPNAPFSVLLWTAFVAWSAISLGWGILPGALTLATWVAAAALMWAATRLPVAQAQLAAMVAATTIGGVSAVVALAQAAGGGRGLAIHGGHGNPNWLGLVLAVSWPLTWGFVAYVRRLHRVIFGGTLIVAALQLVALYLSHARVAWVATALVLLGWGASKRWLRRKIAIATMMAALVAAMALLAVNTWVFAQPPSQQEMSIATNDVESAATDVPVAKAWAGRIWIWQSSALELYDKLPFGTGLGGFAHAYLQGQGKRLLSFEPKDASRQFTNATTAHCDWLQVAVEGGVVAFVLLVLVMASALGAAYRVGWMPGAAALALFCIEAMGDSPLFQPAVVVLLAMLLGALPRTVRLRFPRRTTVVAIVALLVSSAFLLAISTRRWLSVRRVTAARDEEPARQLTLLQSAVRLDPWNGDAALQLGLAKLDLEQPESALDGCA